MKVRQNIGSELGFSKKDRSINVRRIGYVSNIITKHNGIAIASNIAPYNKDRLYNRNLIENNGNKYLEIFIDATLENCIQRDPKGLYKINNEKIIQSYYEFEYPTKSDLIINTNNEKIYDSINIGINYLSKSILHHKHCAMCILGGKIKSIGFNYPDNKHIIKIKNNYIKYCYTRHAEINAIFNLPTNTNYRRVKLIILRENMKMSKPCSLCHNVLNKLGIHKIYYSENGKLKRLK